CPETSHACHQRRVGQVGWLAERRHRAAGAQLPLGLIVRLGPGTAGAAIGDNRPSEAAPGASVTRRTAPSLRLLGQPPFSAADPFPALSSKALAAWPARLRQALTDRPLRAAAAEARRPYVSATERRPPDGRSIHSRGCARRP